MTFFDQHSGNILRTLIKLKYFLYCLLIMSQFHPTHKGSYVTRCSLKGPENVLSRSASDCGAVTSSDVKPADENLLIHRRFFCIYILMRLRCSLRFEVSGMPRTRVNQSGFSKISVMTAVRLCFPLSIKSDRTVSEKHIVSPPPPLDFNSSPKNQNSKS